MLLVLTISTFYFLLFGFITYGWYKLNKTKKLKKNNLTKISLIVAFRNEEKNLHNIVKDISNQDYSEKYFEVIFVNDHSEDKSLEILKKLIEKKDNFKILKLKEFTGKKQALKLGIKNSTGDLIVTTDADCRMKKKWISTISNFYFSSKAKMIVCPVIYSTKKPLFSFGNFQALEFLSLTATTAGSIRMNSPLMCNGANLAFEKKVFLEFINPTKEEIPSGDDTFLLFNINKKYSGEVKYLINTNAIVTTKPAKNIKTFFNQRIRWASKTKYYSQFLVLFSGFVTLTMNLTLFSTAILSSLNIISLKYFLFLLISKTVIDFPILFSASKYFNQQKLLLLYIPLQITYFIYVTIVGILSFFVNYTWKERKH